jgi:tetratricopeptide (TPR) repeat protein
MAGVPVLRQFVGVSVVANCGGKDQRMVVEYRRQSLSSLLSRLVICCSLATCLANEGGPTSAQATMPCHSMETQDETPPAQLPSPEAMTGIGNAHMPITAKPEAQKWFDQGLNLLHDFWDYESARAFEQSVRVDPQCAMCYWGLYKAESFYHSTAQDYAGQALDTAFRLKDHASKREQLYIEATAAQEAAHKNAKSDAGFEKSVDLWRKLARKYPSDDQAMIFQAQVVNHDECVTILRAILNENPNDSAANHYYIHALEGTEHPELALHSADILASLAPASGHMVHMPGHIYFRIGNYAAAEHAFTASMQVDERYMKEQHVQPDNDWNYVHNLMYAVANLMEEGKLNEANRLSMKLTQARGKLESTLYIYSTRDSMTRLDPRLPVALRVGDWQRVIELLNASTLPAGRPNLGFLDRELTNFAIGMQAIEEHDLPKAEQASAQFDAELWRVSQEARVPLGMNSTAPPKPPVQGPPKLRVLPDALQQPLINSFSVMSSELRASILTGQGKTDEANTLFSKAAQQEKALGYREPPAFIRPVGETQGAAMSAVGDYPDAKAAFEKALAERPRSGFALFGVAMASEKSGDIQAAAKGFADFLAAWKDADPTLPQVIHAQTYLAEQSRYLSTPSRLLLH